MSALVTGNSDALNIFFDGGINDYLSRSVVAKMNDFNAGILKNPSHDINGGIVAVKQ